MVNNKDLINNKKLVELVQELKDYEIKKSTLSSAARGKVVNKSGSNYVSDNKEGYGPMYNPSSSSNYFSVEYSFKHGVDNEKLFFEELGEYSNKLKVSGNLQKLRDELRKLENGEIKVFKLAREGNYKRDRQYEETVKNDLKEDIRKFEEMIRSGRIEYNGSGREYDISKSVYNLIY